MSSIGMRYIYRLWPSGMREYDAQDTEYSIEIPWVEPEDLVQFVRHRVAAEHRILEQRLHAVDDPYDWREGGIEVTDVHTGEVVYACHYAIAVQGGYAVDSNQLWDMRIWTVLTRALHQRGQAVDVDLLVTDCEYWTALCWQAQHAADAHAAALHVSRNAAIYRVIGGLVDVLAERGELSLSSRRHPAAWLARQLEQSSIASAPAE